MCICVCECLLQTNIAGVPSSRAMSGFLQYCGSTCLRFGCDRHAGLWFPNQENQNHGCVYLETLSCAAMRPSSTTSIRRSRMTQKVEQPTGDVTGSRCMRGPVSPSRVASSMHAPPRSRMRHCGPSLTIFSRRRGRQRVNNFRCRSASTGARGSGVSACDDTAMGPAHTLSGAIPSIALRFLAGRQSEAHLAQCTGSDRPA